ncbi:hypothetical protein KY290_035283 [Solanum tuberosum]|uniref:Retrotransposon gag domain-containing protein n=1 Tax=Solanum tuberosum TaxID=4113 RepID=A0ABQ7U5P3_SOLTU|nr:hypothetical protein KY289_033432 [Solanum tuberosum]KAH0742240.1 hypothetical protein KY290_035283 [Solanum tuberosum]
MSFRRQVNDWEITRVANFLNTIGQFKGTQEGEDELWWQSSDRGTFRVGKAYRWLNNLENYMEICQEHGVISVWSFHVRFTGKKYSAWEFQFQIFVTGKELWGHIDGSDPTPTDPTKLGQWKVKDARVMTWILGSIDPLIVLNLRPYKTAKAMWDYLRKVYNQDHSARHFQLEHEIAMYSQGGLSVQDYFSRFQNLWAEFIDIVYAKIPYESLSIIQGVHEQSKRDQFLMKL